MSLIIAIWKKARAVAAAPSKSRARRRLTEAQAKVRSTTQRFGWTTKPASVRLMISTGRGAAVATRGSRLIHCALQARQVDQGTRPRISIKASGEDTAAQTGRTHESNRSAQ
jgi:hypothetical protein